MKKIRNGIIAVVIPVICLYLLQCLLTPKYATDIKEGAMIAEYYNSNKNHDVLILGDCEVYENISPATMWENNGITSYIRGSAEQLIWQSYYLLEDTLRYETPKVVVLNVLAMQQAEAKSEAYNRMTIDGMKWSKAKLHSIQESMTEKETLSSYIFPLLRYHSRWSDLSFEDVSYMWKTPNVTTNGYLMQTGVRPVTNLPKAVPLANYQFSDRNYEYLNKIAQLCKEHHIELVLIKAPSVFPHWYDEWEEQIQNFAKEQGVSYLNLAKASEEIGIDYTQDTYDYGQHMNVFGAEKTSVYLADILQNRYNLQDHRNDENKQLIEQWNRLTADYHMERQDKLSQAESGK